MKSIVFAVSLFVMVACSTTNKFELEPDTIRYSRFLSKYLESRTDSIVKTKSLVKNHVFIYSSSDQSTIFKHVQKANMKYFKMYIATYSNSRRIRPKMPHHFPQVTYLPMDEYPLVYWPDLNVK